MFETKIKEVYRGTTYTTLTGETLEELFDNIYMYFKSNQYCWQVDRTFVNKEMEENYNNWVKHHSQELWWKHASGRDFD